MKQKSVKHKLNIITNLLLSIKNNKIITSLIIIYIVAMLLPITWGLPNGSHPFNYYMDEWHQMQSIRELFKNGSPNVPGAANGTIFHWFISGIYLAPFYIFHIVDPFVIKSAFVAMDMQEKIFIILRLNTVLFGILSVLVLVKIAKQYIKIDPILPVIFFIFNPIWLYQSGYFKYDVGLTFWILVAILFLLRFGNNPTFKNYLLAGFFCALTFATKISAIVMFPIYIYAYFYYIKRSKRKVKELISGIGVFFVTFIIFGISDLLFLRGDIREYLVSNLIQSPKIYDNFIISFDPWWLYLITRVLTLDFGYVFLYGSLVAVIYITVISIKKFLKKDLDSYRHETFLLLTFFCFVASMVTLHLGASGNRVLVLLPFMALFVGLVTKNMVNKWRIPFTVLLVVMVSLQVYQSLVIVHSKMLPDPRHISSQWIQHYIKPGSSIGIENIPIYQMLPDFILKEYYIKENDPKYTTKYTYRIVDIKTKILPKYVIVTNREFETQYLKESPKKSLVRRLDREGYSVIKEFKPPEILYQTMGDERDFYMSVLVSIPTIAIYEKR